MGYNTFIGKGGARVNNDISLWIAELKSQIIVFLAGSSAQKYPNYF